VDNLATQVNELMKLRRLIVDTGAINVQIQAKGPGTVIRNMIQQADSTFKAVQGPALSKKEGESLLPDSSLKLAITLNGSVYTSSGTPQEVTNTDLDFLHNVPMVILPMANGEYTAAPLQMADLDIDTDPAAINTIERALWLYLNSSKPEVQAELDEVFKLTGRNMRNSEDLRSFINQQYTYTQRFDDTNTALNPNKEGKFLFNITEPVNGKATIMIGWEGSGQKLTVAKLSGDKLDPKFVEGLRMGLRTRQRNVNFTKGTIKGINSTGKMQEHIFNGKNWKTNTYDSYNDYLKSYATTTVYGRNQLDGKYVYAANPMITLNPESVRVMLTPESVINPVLVVEPVPGGTTPIQEEISSDEEEELNRMSGYSFESAPYAVTHMIPSENMLPVSLSLLQNLHNFTPPGNRNGKTPGQVFEELVRLGIPFIAEGHNPFFKCT
jgi:hypothetical protein